MNYVIADLFDQLHHHQLETTSQKRLETGRAKGRKNQTFASSMIDSETRKSTEKVTWILSGFDKAEWDGRKRLVLTANLRDGES